MKSTVSPIVLSIPPYGFVSNSMDDPGSNGTKARVRAASELIEAGLIPSTVLLPFPQGRYEGQPQSLGENIAEYVKTQPAMKNALVLTAAMSRGTWDDTIASYRLVAKITSNSAVEWHFVSDVAQLWRLRLIWWFTHPKGWTAKFHPVKNFRSWHDLLVHEPISYLKCLGRGARLLFGPRQQPTEFLR